MKGNRVDAISEDDNQWPFPKLNPGEYGKDIDGSWRAVSPNGHLANLGAHQVTEHEDGSITVSPSIGIFYQSLTEFAYHGFLEKGIWRDA